MAQPQMTQQQAAQAQAQAAYNNNIQLRRLLVHGAPPFVAPAVNLWQPLILALPSVIAPGTLINVPVRNVGLVKRLIMKITGTITAGASVENLTPVGLSNLLSNVTFFDLGNNTRINTTGWHLVAVASAKRRRPWGAAMTNDSPLGYANNFSAIKSAASIAGAGNTTFTMFFEIPFVRSDDDLRGLIFGDTTASTMQAQVTFNPNMFVASTGDPTNAVYQSVGADVATLSAVVITTYQNYLDQGPRDQNGAPLVPGQDIGTAYVLTQTSTPLPVANQLNANNFVNQRQFLSLTVIYDNAGVLNAGTDITQFQIVSANFTQIMAIDPIMAALMARIRIGDDFPKGMYYFDFTDRPIDTVQYGNMQFITQPSSVGGSTATFLLGWEAYGTIGLINQGSSYPSGGGA